MSGEGDRPIPPPDRGRLLTEQRLEAAREIDALPTDDALRLVHAQHARLQGVVEAALPQVAALVRDVTGRMRDGGRLIYIGAGTSGRLGVLDASEIPPTFHADPGQVVGIIAGGDAALRRSSEGKEDDAAGPLAEFGELDVCERDVVIGIMAGGTTPWVWGGLALARQRGCVTGLICCVPVEDVAAHEPGRQTEIDSVTHVIALPVGPEVVTGSTRMLAGTATKMVLNLIGTQVMIELGTTWGDLMVDLRATNAKLRDRAARIIMSQTDLTREDALRLLEAACGRVKAALVMGLKCVELREADRLLADHGGHLRPLLGPPRD